MLIAARPRRNTIGLKLPNGPSLEFASMSEVA
jgi:hypothetical protein